MSLQDVYIMMNMTVLVLVCIWHAIIPQIAADWGLELAHTSDVIVLSVLGSIFIVTHTAFALWIAVRVGYRLLLLVRLVLSLMLFLHCLKCLLSWSYQAPSSFWEGSFKRWRCTSVRLSVCLSVVDVNNLLAFARGRRFTHCKGRGLSFRCMGRYICIHHSSRTRFYVFLQNPKNATFCVFWSVMSKNVKKTCSTFLYFEIANGHFHCKTITHMSCYTYKIILKLFILVTI